MTELVAVRGELQLFAAGDVGVIVDTQALDVYDPAPLSELLAQDGWTTAENRDKAMMASAHVDLAETQLQTHDNLRNVGRTFRVPKTVREAAAQGLDWRNDPTKPTGGTPFGVGIARKLLSGTVSEDTIKKMAEFHAKHAETPITADGRITSFTVANSLWGGETGATWSMRITNIVNPTPVTAAGVDDTEADAGSSEPQPILYFAQLDPNSDGPTFVCLGMFANDNGGWFVREDGEWLPTDAPNESTDLALLDEESRLALEEQVDDPTTTTLELSISPARLVELALPELDLDALDKVFAGVPYVDPAVRSRNASKQVRDANGKFIQVGARLTTGSGKSGTVVATNDDGTVDIDTGNGVEKVPAGDAQAEAGAAGVKKATLKAPATILPDVAGRIQQYITESGAASPAAPPMEFAEGNPVDTPAAAPAAPGGSTATPLYLAIVDPSDTQAVLDLVAIIPNEAGNGVEAYTRVGGAWTSADSLLSDLQGSTPPPVVELDQANLTDVIAQIDSGSAEEAPAEPAPAPVAASITVDDNGIEIVNGDELTVFSLTADGRLFSQSVAAPVQLPAYGLTPYPEDVIHNLDKFAEGGLDKNRGNAERLRRYWTKGEGAAKIRWGTDGDWTRCVAELSEHLGARAKGYCTLRHKDALGYYPGEKDRPGNPESMEVAPDLATLLGEFTHPEPVDAPEVIAVEGAPLEGSPKENPDDPYWQGDHPYEDSEVEGTACFCGKEPEDAIHVVSAEAPSDEEADPKTEDMPALSADASMDESGLPGGGTRFTIPLVVPEGRESGDGRSFAVGALTSRDMPLALMWQMITDEGHKQSVIVGRVDHVEQLPEGGLGNASGVFDTGPYGQEALRLVRAGMLRGISADLDMFEANVMQGGEDENRLAAQKMEITAARLMGITLVAKPAFAECVIMLDEGEDPEVTDGIYTERTSEAVVAALVAAAAPLEPPKAWFENPNLDKPTHLTVTDDGRVFGHIAAWDVHHSGLPYGTRPPRSVSNYAYFRTGSRRTAEGDDVRVGQLTLWGGHAPLQADARTAVQHYDETKSAVCDLAAGEDRHGIWVSGALRPGVTPEQVRALRASSPSGDWRPIKGQLELVAVCQVNVPGFPIAQSMVAGGMVTALVAAGIQPLVEEKHERELGIKGQISYIESALNSLLADRANAAAARIRPAQQERKAALTASAKAAADRIATLKAERDAVLAEKAEKAKAIVAALRVRPEFDEDKHLRDEEGKFREKLATLKDKLSSPETGPAAAEGLRKLEDAADQEDAGETEESNKTGEAAADALQRAADSAAGETKAALEDAAEDVRQTVARLRDGVEGKETAFDELPQAIKDLLEDALDKLEQQMNPGDPDVLVQKLKGFITGTNPMSATEILNLLKRQVEQETTNRVQP